MNKYYNENSGAVDLNIIVSSIENSGAAFTAYVDEFNQYAKQNNLDINLKMNLLTINNFSVSMENTNIMYESIFNKKNSAYDLFFYDASWTHKYCPYFVDLSKYLDEDHIKMYDENVVSQLCRCGDSLIGL
ncbi:hypothetical protein PIROE2DRAFT_4379, partial [Piromyces sp. E2]